MTEEETGREPVAAQGQAGHEHADGRGQTGVGPAETAGQAGYEAAAAEPERQVPGIAVSRRGFVIGGAVLGLAALAGLGYAAFASCNAQATGQLTGVAGDAAQNFMGSVSQVGRDVQARAAAGEGIVSGTVCIDAGHGGGSDLTLTPIGPGSSDMQYVEPGGTSGVVTGVEESAVTLAVALLLRDKLRDQGITVVMVREDDSRCYSSEERAEVANSCNADIFLRLHCDGSDSSEPSGFSTLIPGYNEWTADIVDSSAQVANLMHPIIVAETGARDAGIVERTDLAGFNFCKVPVVLFEMGFMSNPEEDQRLCSSEYQETLAQAICDATVAYLESKAE